MNPNYHKLHNLINFFITLLFIILNIFILKLSTSSNIYIFLFSIFLFIHINNGVFSLLHESVHDSLFTNKTFNYLSGVLLSIFFPTSYTLQKIAHSGHHKRNRTDQELYDYILPNESVAKRFLWLYLGNMLGFYYISYVILNIIFLICPFLLKSKYFTENISYKLGFGPYINEIKNENLLKLWLELLFSFSCLLILTSLLNISLSTLLILYYAFALHWSVLQYADHAFSARDIKNGAWNLKVLPLFRYMSLNYHYHKAHHQNPQIPWYYAPKFVDKNTYQPTFWKIYFKLWAGPIKAPPFGCPDNLEHLNK